MSTETPEKVDTKTSETEMSPVKMNTPTTTFRIIISQYFWVMLDETCDISCWKAIINIYTFIVENSLLHFWIMAAQVGGLVRKVDCHHVTKHRSHPKIRRSVPDLD